MCNQKITRPWMILLLAVLVFPTLAMAERQKRIAVLDFEVDASGQEGQSAVGSTRNVGKEIADLLVNRLSQLGTYTVIERRQLRRILDEQKLAAKGLVDEETAARVGGVLGVDALVIGNVKTFNVVNKRSGLLEMTRIPSIMKSLRPGKSVATVGVIFKLVNAHTGAVHWGGEATGTVERKVDKPELDTLIYGKESMSSPEFTRTVLGQATNDAVNRMVTQIQERAASLPDAPMPRTKSAAKAEGSNYTPRSKGSPDGANRAGGAKPSSEGFEGSVLQIKGGQVVVEITNKGNVKNGDVLKVRRVESITNSKGKKIQMENIIGQLDVIDVQDEVIIGRYRASDKTKPLKANDLVTSH